MSLDLLTVCSEALDDLLILVSSAHAKTHMASQAQRVVIRPPQRLPEHSEGSGDIPSDRNHEIIIKHPGYDDGYNVILMLPALDRSAGGLDHATVLVICGILTGNRWHGCLTRERDGQPVPQDGFLIVPVGEYYFYPAAPSVGGKPGQMSLPPLTRLGCLMTLDFD